MKVGAYFFLSAGRRVATLLDLTPNLLRGLEKLGRKNLYKAEKIAFIFVNSISLKIL
jgi:hypothetical protein